MQVLFFDTETTGIPKEKGVSPSRSNLNNWPYILEIAWIIRDDEDNKILDTGREILKPGKFRIPKAASDIHGITRKIAERDGVERADFFYTFHSRIQNVGAIVAHNLEFDMNILMAEFIRHNLHFDFHKTTHYCTMKCSTDFCQIPAKYGKSKYKWPTLDELHRKLFQESFQGAHSAKGDLDALLRCFDKLRELGKLNPQIESAKPGGYGTLFWIIASIVLVCLGPIGIILALAWLIIRMYKFYFVQDKAGN